MIPKNSILLWVVSSPKLDILKPLLGLQVWLKQPWHCIIRFYPQLLILLSRILNWISKILPFIWILKPDLGSRPTGNPQDALVSVLSVLVAQITTWFWKNTKPQKTFPTVCMVPLMKCCCLLTTPHSCWVSVKKLWVSCKEMVLIDILRL